MQSNWEKFQDAYTKAPAEVKTLIDSEQIPIAVTALLIKHHLEDKNRRALTTAMSYYLLGLVDLKSMLNELSSLGVTDDIQMSLALEISQTVKTLKEKSAQSVVVSAPLPQSPLPGTSSATTKNYLKPASETVPTGMSAQTTPAPRSTVATAPNPPQAVFQPVIPPTASTTYDTVAPSPIPSVAQVPIAGPASSARLTSLSEPVVSEPLPVTKPVSSVPPLNIPNPFTATPPPPQTERPADIAPVRTMDTDNERIHGYGAYREKYPELYGTPDANKNIIHSVAQDALLKRAPVVPTPDFSSDQANDGRG